MKKEQLFDLVFKTPQGPTEKALTAHDSRLDPVTELISMLDL